VIEYVQRRPARSNSAGVQVSASQLLERFLFPPPSKHSPISKLLGRRRPTASNLSRLAIQPQRCACCSMKPTTIWMCRTLTVLEGIFSRISWLRGGGLPHRYFLDRTMSDRLFGSRTACSSAFEANYSAYLAQAGPAHSAGRTSNRRPPEPRSSQRRPQSKSPPVKALATASAQAMENKAAGAERRAAAPVFSEKRETQRAGRGQRPRLEAQRSQLRAKTATCGR